MTVIFSDGWEVAQDFTTNWTGSGGSPVVNSDIVFDGVYSAEAAGTYGVIYQIYKTITEVNEIYFGTYVYYNGANSVPPLDTNNILGPVIIRNGTISLSYTRIYNNSGTIEWRLIGKHDDDSITTDTDAVTGFNHSTWYWIELYWKRATGESTNDGIVRLYIDGALSCEITTLDNYDRQVNRIELVNLYDNVWSYSNEPHWDYIIAADAYIGPKATGTKTSSSIASLMMPMVVNRLI